MTGLSHTSDKLFRAIVSTMNGKCLRRGGGFELQCLRELLLAKIEQLGMDPRLFSMHSLRAGGTTAAANAR